MTALPDVSPAAEVVQRFAEEYRATASGVWAAPGRVNLIGEHTDYNDGFVLPFALRERVFVAASARGDGRLRASSIQEADVVDVDIAQLSAQTRSGVPPWGRYVAGVAWALREHGVRVRGADLLVDGHVPLGAGLSSSAAIGCAAAITLASLSQAELDPRDLAGVVHRSENDFVGAPTGMMDQLASILGTAGHALLIDVQSGQTRPVPFEPAADRLTLLVIDTRVRHAHAGGEYADRRRSCEEAARLLGVRSLRELTDDVGLDQLPDPLRRRVRHVVTENARVLAAVDALERRDWPGLGRRMTASHVSLRDDYEVSCTELDVAVDVALSAGALGARMTGGGFGGSAIALVPDGHVPWVRDGLRKAFVAKGWREPAVTEAEPADGASRLR